MIKILVVDDETDLEVLIKQKFRQKIREHEFEFVFAVTPAFGSIRFSYFAKQQFCGKSQLRIWASALTRSVNTR